MDENRQQTMTSASLPAHARLPINHCNLPPVILGCLTFQHHPTPLHLDGVEQLHAALFQSLDPITDADTRAEHFKDYMRSSFLLDNLDEAGFDALKSGVKRGKADYLRILRGWLFDADSKEAAVLKSWIESRFGLLPLNHKGPLGDGGEDNYQAYLSARAQGLYNTNALESQLDLLYSYCQYEVARQYTGESHVTLYRGINRIDEHEILHQPAKNIYILALNNINSFSSNRERADEFGDYILEAKVPLTKLLYMPGLLPSTLKGEVEYLVIGGVYEVKVSLL
ncbi:NAD(+)--dinitrogen-reductase ADP-D-ribosyltransferase [Solemya velesiana gill symbiont]|uniref:NAD(+)--dinitrogen-reductase ADP-D-ribosyltransferase n=1 Tax=Solemya velesiana gill symbiont TaxID=1918948 RepID=A0A1T2KVI4_9GAMM|nr:NAD(+)--dinitrogen-reductase ADP-D-ribosyltransferase [Solemya velesiana gill symbiont]OOZ36855.1 NAD(+)--dinitrogen-reductase ADP-D-ribosyltransferase [Solemya velesiana gill symbiont]